HRLIRAAADENARSGNRLPPRLPLQGRGTALRPVQTGRPDRPETRRETPQLRSSRRTPPPYPPRSPSITLPRLRRREGRGRGEDGEGGGFRVWCSGSARQAPAYR